MAWYSIRHIIQSLLPCEFYSGNPILQFCKGTLSKQHFVIILSDFSLKLSFKMLLFILKGLVIKFGTKIILKLEFHQENWMHQAASGRKTDAPCDDVSRPDATGCVRISQWNSSLTHLTNVGNQEKYLLTYRPIS